MPFPNVSDSTGGTCEGLSLHPENQVNKNQVAARHTEPPAGGRGLTDPSLNGYKQSINRAALGLFKMHEKLP